MPFGPEFSVHSYESRPDKVCDVVLSSFTSEEAGTVLPFAPDDPSLPYLGAYLPPILIEGPEAYSNDLVEDKGTIVWGVFADRRLAGFATLGISREAGTVGYSIVLGQHSRGRGIGLLATVGMIATAKRPGLLRRTNPDFPWFVQVIDTSIHPDNAASQIMCERASFEFKGFNMQSIPQGDFPWNRYELRPEEITHVDQKIPLELFIGGGIRYSVLFGEDLR